MTTLPDAYARCHGRIDDRLEREVDVLKASCIYCLRRTAPMRENVLYSYFAPPEFTTTCPERIAP